MQPRRLPQILLATLASQALLACSGSDDAVGGTIPLPTIDTLTYKVFSNASDPRILSARTPNGETLAFFGNKSPIGAPLDLYAVTVEKNAGAQTTETTLFELDSSGLPTTVTASNGGVIQIDWDVDGQTGVLTAVSPSGLQQVNTLVDFGAGASGTPLSVPASTWDSRAPAPDWSARGGQPSWGIELDLGAGAWLAELPQANTGSNETLGAPLVPRITTTVSGCGLPANSLQVVTRLFDEATGSWIATLPMPSVGEGLYSTTLPFGAVSLQNSEANCLALAQAVELGCSIEVLFGQSAVDSICSALSNAIAAIQLPPEEAAALSQLCTETLPLLDLVCAAAGAAAPADGTPLEQALCESEFVEGFDLEQVRLETCVLGGSSNLCSQSLVIGTGPESFPVSNSIDLGDETLIRSLTLNPSSPIAGQNDIAIADIVCIAAGSELVLSIVGTDGYTDSIQFDFADAQGQGLFQLSVPGAAQGVQDVVTATLQMPDGSSVVRTASLVFG